MEFPKSIIRNNIKLHVHQIFSQVTFEQDSRQHYLKLLGYDPTELAKKVNHHNHYNCDLLWT